MSFSTIKCSNIFFPGGSGTVSKTLAFAILYMVKNPIIQARVFAEMKDVLSEKGETYFYEFFFSFTYVHTHASTRCRLQLQLKAGGDGWLYVFHTQDKDVLPRTGMYVSLILRTGVRTVRTYAYYVYSNGEDAISDILTYRYLCKLSTCTYSNVQTD